ncbi:MAG TPA: hypothetical protein VGS57_22545 [Thermoanaerobaculia bacterium]|nr:hypothetical protein [Thermoanaerobaculia bacterium]
MTGPQRFGAVPIAAWLAALFLLPAAARPSCETAYCRHQRDLDARALEVQARAELERDPADLAKWQALMDVLVNKPRRELAIARHLAHVDWQAPPELEIDLEARIRAERAAWIADWKLAFPDRGEPWCAEAKLEESPAAQIELLRIAAARRPDDAVVQGCLAETLFLGGRDAEGIALLEAFVAGHPDDPAAHSHLVDLLRYTHAPAEKLRAALEERARRFADDLRARHELLQFYDANGLDEPRDRLLAEIETAGDLRERHVVCSSIVATSESSRAARTRCFAHLLDDVGAAELPEDQRRAQLEGVRYPLLLSASEAGDWEAIRGVLASWPPGDLGKAWATVASSTKTEGCQALHATWDSGALRPSLAGSDAAYQASNLAGAFRRCGETSLADELERPFVARAPDDLLATMSSDDARTEAARRGGATAEELRRWRDDDDDARDRPTAERLPGLLAWHEGAPTDPEPALRLSRAHAAAGHGEEAVRWLLEAAALHPSRGEDLQLQAAALALRFRLHDAAATIARKMLAAPATPRQHAEAHYVLGRVALREGRREEAATELLGYFPLRMRFVAGCGASPDRGLLMLLLANYDLPRLRAYLAERDGALAWYREHLYHPHPKPGNDLASMRAFAAYREPLSCLGEPLPPALEPELTSACVLAGTIEYLASEGNGVAPAGERARRRVEAKAGLACPRSWRSDLEPLFEDEKLLSFGEELSTTADRAERPRDSATAPRRRSRVPCRAGS